MFSPSTGKANELFLCKKFANKYFSRPSSGTSLENGKLSIEIKSFSSE
jgi:hypothetical protein